MLQVKHIQKKKTDKDGTKIKGTKLIKLNTREGSGDEEVKTNKNHENVQNKTPIREEDDEIVQVNRISKASRKFGNSIGLSDDMTENQSDFDEHNIT